MILGEEDAPGVKPDVRHPLGIDEVPKTAAVYIRQARHDLF